jgi:hypothetical protein
MKHYHCLSCGTACKTWEWGDVALASTGMTMAFWSITQIILKLIGT